jgi:Arc/MetJ-type ribon-helix-helix transcriptional regulator
MKRITVSLPDEFVERIKLLAGKEPVSSYVAKAIVEYQERETLDQILAAWRAQTPTTEDTQQQAAAELDHAGIVEPVGGHEQMPT